MREHLPKPQFDWIFSGVPRLTVETVISSPERVVLLSLRDIDPCQGMWHLPGGTVRFGEPVADAVKRVAERKLSLTVSVGRLLGHIEYPSPYNNGLDSPVGLAFTAAVEGAEAVPKGLPDDVRDEQRRFLIKQGRVRDAVARP